MKRTLLFLFILLGCSAAFAASDSYIIHVSEYNNSRIIISYSGDLNGQVETPFDLSSDTPFTVTLSAPYAVPMIESDFEYWILDDVNQPMDKQSVTVTADDTAAERTAWARYAYGTPPPMATPTPTPAQPTTHVIHITSSTFPAGEGNIQITYTGDYSGQGVTPFDIGPSGQPFTVTLSAPGTAFVPGASNTLVSWSVNGEMQYPSPITNLTVSTGTGTPEMNIIAQYVHMEPTPVVDWLTGDVDGNGAVSIIDALLVAQYYVGLSPASFNPDVADVNCDGSITIVDALLIAQYYVGLITQFC